MTRFDPARESEFRDDYGSRTLSSVRFGLVLGAVLFGLFAILDIWMLPESWPSAHLIRFAVVIPVCGTAIASTFIGFRRSRLQIIASAFVISAGLGIVGMIACAEENELGFQYYYAGLLLVLTYSFAVVRLRFLPAAICCVTIISAYILIAVFDQRLLADGLLRGSGPVFLNNNYFLIAAGIITMMGSYVLEDYARKDFHQRKELSGALEDLKETQSQLIQSERTNAMGNVVAGLLHELNNPVGAIASASDVVNRGAQKLRDLHEGEPSTRWVQTLAIINDNAAVIRQGTKRVTRALDVLKRFTHLDQAETAEYDVNTALEDCVTLLARETGERIDVERHFSELPKIHCRPSEINQLFMSLLNNAVEAIPHDGRVELRTSFKDAIVRVDIIDSGVGMAERQLKELFVPQFSRDRTRVKLGLGLTTSQNIVQRHGGSIHVESDVGKGTRVSVTLPKTLVGTNRHAGD